MVGWTRVSGVKSCTSKSEVLNYLGDSDLVFHCTEKCMTTH